MANNRVDYTMAGLKEMVAGYWLDDEASTAQVPTELQQLQLAAMDQQIDHERFYFVVDVMDFEMSHVRGVMEWLGYPDESFSLERFARIVHPSYKFTWPIFVKNILHQACSGKYKLGFMEQHFSCTLALRHYNGEYLLVKKTASVFQYDGSNRLTEYFNECNIISSHTVNSDLNPRIMNGDHGYLNKEDILFNLIRQDFLALKVFSPKELQFAKLLIEVPGIRMTAIAHEWDVSVSTVDTYSKRFLYKAREFFNNHFATSTEAAAYMANALFL